MIRKGSKEAEGWKDPGSLQTEKNPPESKCDSRSQGYGSGTPSAYMDRCGSVGTEEKRKENPAIGREDALVFAMSSQRR